MKKKGLNQLCLLSFLILTIVSYSHPFEAKRRDSEKQILCNSKITSHQHTDHRTRERRAVSYEYSTAGFGPATMSNIVSRDLAYSFFFGRIWEVNPYAGIRVIIDATTDFRNSVLASLNMGLNLIPFQEEIFPYVAPEFGFGYGREEDDNLFGFNAAVALGVVLFRSAAVQMVIEGKAGFLFDDIANGFPTLYAIRVGINY